MAPLIPDSLNPPLDGYPLPPTLEQKQEQEEEQEPIFKPRVSYSCNGVFTDQYIFRSIFRNFDHQIRLTNQAAKTVHHKIVYCF